MSMSWLPLSEVGLHATALLLVATATFLTLVVVIAVVAVFHADSHRRRDARRLLKVLLNPARRQE